MTEEEILDQVQTLPARRNPFDEGIAKGFLLLAIVTGKQIGRAHV